MTPLTAPKGVAVLGSTGSIGTTALRVLDRQRDLAGRMHDDIADHVVRIRVERPCFARAPL